MDSVALFLNSCRSLETRNVYQISLQKYIDFIGEDELFYQNNPRLIEDRRLSEDQFGKIQIDRTEEIRNWANKMKQVQNEKDVKIGIVAANNHYGGYGPGTVDIFRQSMDMEKLSFDDVDVAKINRDMKSETRFTFNDTKQPKKGKQTSISDFVN